MRIRNLSIHQHEKSLNNDSLVGLNYHLNSMKMKKILLLILVAMLAIPQVTWAQNAIILDENEDNSSIIRYFNGKTCNVTMRRTIVAGMYNTLCLPFDVNYFTLKKVFGDDVELLTLNGSHMDGDELIFEFEHVNEYGIIAGWPYLINVSKEVINPPFHNVTIKEKKITIETEFVDFLPIYSPTSLENGNQNILFLGANNLLYYPSVNSGKMKGFRAYFYQKNNEVNGAKATINVDDFTTGIMSIIDKKEKGIIHDLQGRKISNPTKGLYIINGKKILIK